jgi:hypothetical protein
MRRSAAPVTGADGDHGAAERVAKELLLGVHVRRVQMVVPIHDRTFSSNANLRAGPGQPRQWRIRGDSIS